MKFTLNIPAPALLLCLAGLIPFWASPVLAWLSVSAGRSPATEAALYTIYGAIILGFLGGVRWGEALLKAEPSWRALTLSILSSLVGLAAVLLHWASGAPAGIAVILFGLAGQMMWDRRASAIGRLPSWYGRLRALLTLGAALAGFALYAIVRLA